MVPEDEIRSLKVDIRFLKVELQYAENSLLLERRQTRDLKALVTKILDKGFRKMCRNIWRHEEFLSN